jgi:hypothetical protein
MLVRRSFSEIFVPFLRNIFNLRGSQQYFSILWKQAVIVPVFKGGGSGSVNEYRPVSINHFSIVFEFIIHDPVSHYLKLKLNPFLHDFTKSDSHRDFIVPLVCS